MCFGADGIDELDEVGELVEAVVVVSGVEADTEGADAGVAVEAESFDDAFVVANEIGVESNGGGDSGASGLAVAREPQSLDFGDIVGSVTSADVAPNADALGAPATTVGQALQDVNWNNIGGFPTDNDVRIALWTAANKIGVMELNRPEDIEWNANDPSGTPRLYGAFTNHGRQVALDQNGVLFDPTQHETLSPTRPDPVGSIFAMQEADPANPATSKTFTYFMAWQGTEGQGPLDVGNPDNLMLDAQGGLWFGTDGNFGLNGTADGLYYLDLDPAHQSGQPGIVMATFGQAFRVVAGPGDSEFTGPAFNADMTTLFSNIQHLGESFETDPSTWPPR